MINRMRSWLGILRWGLRSAWHWRWRLFAMSALIFGTLCLHLLLSVMVFDAKAGGMARIEPLQTSYFDVLVVLEPSQKLWPYEELQPYQRHLVETEEHAVLLTLATDFGPLTTLGLRPQSAFFRIPVSELTGDLRFSPDSMVLPLSWAERTGLKPGDSLEVTYCGIAEDFTWTARISGFYNDLNGYPAALTDLSALLPFTPENSPNAWLLNYPRQEATLSQLTKWLAQLYPKAALICDDLPKQLGASMLDQAYQPSGVLSYFLFVFLGVGVLTVALITFIERRPELASLKATGISNSQLIALLGVEYACAEVSALIVFALVYATLTRTTPWFEAIPAIQLGSVIIQGGLLGTFALACGLVYPILIARVATVNQLLFARVIPLQVRAVHSMERPTRELTLQEVMENVRMMQIPYALGHYDCMVFISTGSHVKKGEVIASQEQFQGHQISNYHAPCDGVVLDMRGSLIIIRPDNLREPFYPYDNRPYRTQQELDEVLNRVIEEQRLQKRKWWEQR